MRPLFSLNDMTDMYGWKGYKAVSPNETIDRIRRILAGIGVNTECREFGKDGICRSVRVILSDKELRQLGIGTNGKGMDEDYAMASAYAEMMERLQNKMLIFTSKYASPRFRENNPALADNCPGLLSFRYFPDEQYRRIDDEKLCRLAHKFLPGNILFNTPSTDSYDMPFLPFYNMSSGETEHLPYDLIRFAAGSTGLCAGNIPEEAILQGLNEIFERYVLQQTYIRQPRFPRVDIRFFKDTEIGKRLLRLKQMTDWELEIMDCSLGGLFPVMGLLISDNEKNTYTFRLGADFDPSVALQRCLSEIFQGTDIDKSPFISKESMSGHWHNSEEFRKSLINGRGQFPPGILQGGRTDAPAEILDRQPTIKGNFNAAIRWLKSKGHTLYIRDNSFLGFPSYHLYIPGLSDVNHVLYNIRKDLLPVGQYYSVKKEYRINNLSEDEIRIFIREYSSTSIPYIPLFDYLSPRYGKINRNLMLALLSFKTGDNMSSAYMAAFLNEMEKCGIRLSPYYYCLKDYMALAYNGISPENIRQRLMNGYADGTVDEVMSISYERILDGLPLPDCFNCKRCSVREHCSYSAIVEFESSIQRLQSEHIIDQSELRTLGV